MNQSEIGNKFGNWVANFFGMLVAFLFILVICVIMAWPVGFLFKCAHKLYSFGYGLW